MEKFICTFITDSSSLFSSEAVNQPVVGPHPVVRCDRVTVSGSLNVDEKFSHTDSLIGRRGHRRDAARPRPQTYLSGVVVVVVVVAVKKKNAVLEASFWDRHTSTSTSSSRGTLTGPSSAVTALFSR